MKKNIIIAGGGTGGHIYPGIALAQEIQKLDQSIQVHFVGTPLGLESQIVPKAGYPLHLVKVGKLNKSVGIKNQLITLLRLPLSLFECLKLLWAIKPLFVLGVGGYASGPIVLIASLLGIPTGIWEPNAYPGLANRILKFFVKQIYVVFPESAKYFSPKNVVSVGLPVRAKIKNIGRDSTTSRKFHVFIFGGSQGARAINRVVAEAVNQDPAWRKNIEIVHQVGKSDFSWAKEIYKDVDASVKYLEFIEDMESRYAWSDLVFCRGGINTIAELAAAGRTGVIIPLPTAADNHQQKNAETLVDADAAKMVLQKDFNADTFKKIILNYMDHPDELVRAETNVIKFHRPNAGVEMATLIVKELN